MVEKSAFKFVDYIKNLPWNNIFYMFYLEPIVFVLVFSHSLSGTILKNQAIYQTCTTVFDYNETDCEQLGTKNISTHVAHIETEVQAYVVDLFMIRTLLESIVPAICGVFIGSWSDHYGRKPLLLVSMIGFSFTYVITAVICALSFHYPVNPWYYIIAVIPHSVLGGNCVFSVAAFCFLSDITTTKTRPLRMIVMEIYYFIGLMSGNLLSSYVYSGLGPTITFCISGGFMCAATLYIAVWVPESLNLHKEDEEEIRKKTEIEKITEDVEIKTMPTSDTQDKDQIKAEEKLENLEKNSNETEQEAQAKSASFFSYVHIKEMLNTCTKERPCHGRAIIWLATLTMFLSIFVFDGVIAVFYLFVREKFHWTVRDFSYYETVNHTVSMLGAVLGFLILRKLLNMSVVSMALLAFVSDVLMSIMRGCAEQTWHLYLSVFFGVFRNLGGPLVRTIVSNIVPTTDLGKIFSIKNVLQSIAPFLSAPLYGYVYKKSIKSFPGLFNLVSAALYAIAVILLIFILRFKYMHKKHYAELLK